MGAAAAGHAQASASRASAAEADSGSRARDARCLPKAGPGRAAHLPRRLHRWAPARTAALAAEGHPKLGEAGGDWSFESLLKKFLFLLLFLNETLGSDCSRERARRFYPAAAFCLPDPKVSLYSETGGFLPVFLLDSEGVIKQVKLWALDPFKDPVCGPELYCKT